MREQLTTQKGTTKDAKGCEFTYTMYGVFTDDIDLDTLKTSRTYSEKTYIADHNRRLKATSLKELKQLVAN